MITKSCFSYDCAATCCSEEEIKIVGGTASLGLVVEKLNCGEAAVAGIGCASDNGEACVSVAKAGDKAAPGFHLGSNVTKADGEESSATGELETSVASEDRLALLSCPY